MKSFTALTAIENYFRVQTTKNKVSGVYGNYARRRRGEERCMQDFGEEILGNGACKKI